MTIINSRDLLACAPIKDMLNRKAVAHGMTHGCSEAGYDIRIKQEIRFRRALFGLVRWVEVDGTFKGFGRFALASAIEEFDMPDHLLGRVCDKSSWARKGLSVFNTVIEPGFIGGLTLELVCHGNTELVIPAGAPIAQVLFEEVKNPARYKGKYQFQSTDPTPARHQEI